MMLKRFIVVLFILALLLAACSAGANKDDIFTTIGINEVTTYEDDGYVVLDMREVDEFEIAHIQGALNIPLSTIQADEYTLDQAEKYVVICRSGNRSEMASAILFEAGYDVTNVAEGMSSWTGDIE